MLILRVWTLIYNNITNKYYTSFIFYIPSTDFNHQDMNCYNLSSSIRAKKGPYIELTQENLIEFLVQSIYLYICYIYHCHYYCYTVMWLDCYNSEALELVNK